MNLLDAFLGRGIQFRRSVSDPNELNICCPFCSETRFRLGVNIAKDLGHCFNCEWRSRRATEDLAEAMDLGILSSGDEGAPDRGGEAESEQPEPCLPDDFVLLAEPPRGSLYRRAVAYLKDRGVKDWQIREKKIGVSFCGRYAYRIIFPVLYGRELQGLVTRDFTGQQEPRYLNSPGMKAVYNSPQTPKKNKAVICEGIFDCLALERVLPVINYDILSLLGHGLTEKQEARLEEYRDIILWPDPDIPGVKGFIGIAKQLAMYHRIFIVPPASNDEGKDAADMEPSQLAYKWAGRTRFTESLELKMRAEVAFSE